LERPWTSKKEERGNGIARSTWLGSAAEAISTVTWACHFSISLLSTTPVMVVVDDSSKTKKSKPVMSLEFTWRGLQNQLRRYKIHLII
jgi:hypothetical protein